MANYFILQLNDESAAYAFKCNMEHYRPSRFKNQSVQDTVTGALDIQSGPDRKVWSYKVKLYGEDTGSFSVSAGSIMTATSIDWGGYDDLITLFEKIIPPQNKLRFRDLEGSESYAFFDRELRPELRTPMPTGESAYMDVVISLLGSSS